jgi:hypothetical protein
MISSLTSFHKLMFSTELLIAVQSSRGGLKGAIYDFCPAPHPIIFRIQHSSLCP